jgi:hypothetical protein
MSVIAETILETDDLTRSTNGNNNSRGFQTGLAFVGKGSKGAKAIDKSVKFNKPASATLSQSPAPNAASLAATSTSTTARTTNSPSTIGDLIDYSTDTDTSDVSTTSSSATPPARANTPVSAPIAVSVSASTSPDTSSASSSSASSASPDALPATLDAASLKTLAIREAAQRQDAIGGVHSRVNIARTKPASIPSTAVANKGARRSSVGTKAKGSAMHKEKPGRGRSRRAKHTLSLRDCVDADDLAVGFGLEREQEKERAAREGMAKNGIPGYVPYDHDD